MNNTTLPLAYQSVSSKVVPMTVYRVLDYDEALIGEVRAVQLELLKKLVSVCEANGLTVFLMYGSLLGCVRNGGFIPGDDDIDVALMRNDYDKLMALAQSFTGDYFLQTPANDDCFYGGYAKLRKNGTSCIVPQNWYKNCNEGICIDIFPVDYTYADKKKERKKLRRIRQLQRFLYARSYGFFARFQDMPLLEWKLYKYAGMLVPREQMLDSFSKVLAAHDSEARCCIYTHYASQDSDGLPLTDASFSSELVKSFQKVDFEGVPVNIPCGWESLLKLRYGNSFLEMNPSHGQMKLRHGFYSVDTPFEVYKKRFSRAGKNIRAGQKLVLVGDNAGMSEFYEQFGGRLVPSAIVTTHTVEWPLPEAFGNVERLALQDLKGLADSGSYIVIAGVCFREVEELLKKQDVSLYYIFARNRDWLRLANPEDALWELSRRLC